LAGFQLLVQVGELQGCLLWALVDVVGVWVPAQATQFGVLLTLTPAGHKDQLCVAFLIIRLVFEGVQVVL
jgi:hypothetical protein